VFIYNNLAHLGCSMRKACPVAVIAALIISGVTTMIPQSRGCEKTEPPAQSDTTEELLKDLEGQDRFVRAAAIDLLADRKAKEAIPKLIDLLTDYRALHGSDNWVGGHAANALSAISGRPFSIDQKEWKRWWKEQKRPSSK
jgi:hypothetical protein